MRRLILGVLGLALVGLAVYRARAIDEGERRLGIGRYAGQPSSAPS
jgi:hypothetical protein